jgi:hypothetical protein
VLVVAGVVGLAIAMSNAIAAPVDGHPWLNVGAAVALLPLSILLLRSRWATPTRPAGRLVGRWGSGDECPPSSPPQPKPPIA